MRLGLVTAATGKAPPLSPSASRGSEASGPLSTGDGATPWPLPYPWSLRGRGGGLGKGEGAGVKLHTLPATTHWVVGRGREERNVSRYRPLTADLS